MVLRGVRLDAGSLIIIHSFLGRGNTRGNSASTYESQHLAFRPETLCLF